MMGRQKIAPIGEAVSESTHHVSAREARRQRAILLLWQGLNLIDDNTARTFVRSAIVHLAELGA